MPNKQKTLTKIRVLSTKRRLIDQELRDLVAVLRSPDMAGYCDASWQEIGDALGVTKQAAQQRYGHGHQEPGPFFTNVKSR